MHRVANRTLWQVSMHLRAKLKCTLSYKRRQCVPKILNSETHTSKARAGCRSHAGANEVYLQLY